MFSQHQKHSAVWPILLQSHHRNNNVIAELNQCAQMSQEACLEPESRSFSLKSALLAGHSVHPNCFFKKALNQPTKQLNEVLTNTY